jgi:hypothetical protein
MGEANGEANNYAKRQIELKELEVESKKDGVKDLHVSTKHMPKMASATEPNRVGELCEDFKSFFNSKNQRSVDIQLRQLMEEKGFGDAVFGEGLSLTLWSGIFTRVNPTAPGVFSHFISKKSNH